MRWSLSAASLGRGLIGRSWMVGSRGAGGRCYGRWNHDDGMGYSCCGVCGPSSGRGGDNLNIYDKMWQFLMSSQRTTKRN